MSQDNLYFRRGLTDLEKKNSRGGEEKANQNRTADLYNAIVALSQLSYGPLFRDYCRRILKEFKRLGKTNKDISKVLKEETQFQQGKEL